MTMTEKYDIDKLLNELTLDEKINLLRGKNFWETVDFPSHNLKSICMNDGPHGLRKVKNSKQGGGETCASTLFPCEALMACSFDKDLLYKVGLAIGEEAKYYGTNIVLGTGTGIKRNPLCGRNFEYFSEDPYLSGKMAAAYINGMQSTGVGACLKHFAANNQETLRFCINEIIDKKTLSDIYLKAFKIAIKESNPECIMTSYNKINGVHTSESNELLNDWLRTNINYKGLIMSDWGGVCNKDLAIKNGLNLEMPFAKRNNKVLIKKINKGILSVDEINESAKYVLKEIIKHQDDTSNFTNDIFDKHFDLAQEVAENSIVLAKNEHRILPLSRGDRVLFVGPYSEVERFQGGGSSNLNIYKSILPIDALKEVQGFTAFSKGCSGISSELDEELVSEVVKKSSSYNKVVMFIGTQPSQESEGFDRDNIEIPSNQIMLLKEITNINKNVVVVVSSGSVINIPFLDKIKGVIISYFGGEAYGKAISNILYGVVSPSGKLCESWISKLNQCPSFNYFPGKNNVCEYREGINVGYRYHERVKTPLNFPFGFGLSYSKFSYSNISINQKEEGSAEFSITIDVTNTGKVNASDVVELYISDKNPNAFCAPLELNGFEKVYLLTSETKTISFSLNEDNFEHYSLSRKKEIVNNGNYIISLGTSCRDIFFTKEFFVKGQGVIKERKVPGFINMDNTGSLRISFEDYAKINLDYALTEHQDDIKKVTFTIDSTMNDIKSTFIGKILFKVFEKMVAKQKKIDPLGASMAEKSFLELPIRMLLMQGYGENVVDAIVFMANKHFFKGIIHLLF